MIIRGTWNNGQKHGPAQVICCNGNLIYSENLFLEDNISLKHESLCETDSLMDTTHTSELFQVPMNLASHDIDLAIYVERLNKYISNHSNNEKVFFKPVSSMIDVVRTRQESFSKMFKIQTASYTHDKDLTPESFRENNLQEENFLRNMILQYLSTLRMLYTNYSELCCHTKPKFKSILMRFMFWQMIRDCNLHNRGTSLANIDILIGV